MKPDASQYNPSPQYLGELIKSTGMTRSALASLIGYDERTLRKWMSGDRPFPYVVQFALECLVLSV